MFLLPALIHRTLCPKVADGQHSNANVVKGAGNQQPEMSKGLLLGVMLRYGWFGWATINLVLAFGCADVLTVDG